MPTSRPRRRGDRRCRSVRAGRPSVGRAARCPSRRCPRERRGRAGGERLDVAGAAEQVDQGVGAALVHGQPAAVLVGGGPQQRGPGRSGRPWRCPQRRPGRAARPCRRGRARRGPPGLPTARCRRSRTAKPGRAWRQCGRPGPARRGCGPAQDARPRPGAAAARPRGYGRSQSAVTSASARARARSIRPSASAARVSGSARVSRRARSSRVPGLVLRQAQTRGGRARTAVSSSCASSGWPETRGARASCARPARSVSAAEPRSGAACPRRSRTPAGPSPAGRSGASRQLCLAGLLDCLRHVPILPDPSLHENRKTLYPQGKFDFYSQNISTVATERNRHCRATSRYNAVARTGAPGDVPTREQIRRLMLQAPAFGLPCRRGSQVPDGPPEQLPPTQTGFRYSTNTCGAWCPAVMLRVSNTRLLCSTIDAAS